MTTSTTNTTCSMANTAGLNALIAEVCSNLVTTCGLTQTADSGQVWTAAGGATGTLPGAANTSAGYVILSFNDTLAKGGLATATVLAGGSGYDAGGTHTYTAVPLTGGTGSGAQATVVVTSGVVTSVTITTAGSGYLAGDQLSASNANLGGSGSGLNVLAATLASGAYPVLMKLEFGTAGNTSQFGFWLTIGTQTNGSGTLGGTVTTRTQSCTNQVFTSTSTNYSSLYCYNSTYGVAWMAFKQSSTATTTPFLAVAGFLVARGSTNTGAANSDAVFSITGHNAATSGASTSPPCEQCISYANAAVYPASITNSSSSFGCPLYVVSSYLAGSNFQVMPLFYMAPLITMSAIMGVVQQADVAYNATFTATLIGSTSLTFINAGGFCGTSYGPGNQSGTSIGWNAMGTSGSGQNNAGYALIWQ